MVNIQRSLERSEVLAQHLWDNRDIPASHLIPIAMNFVEEMTVMNKFILEGSPNAL